jgi:hypothetical protein
MDEPYYYLGRSHRILFHDSESAYVIADESYPGDPNAVMAAYNHLYYDEACSRDRAYKKMLEGLELSSRKERKKDLAAKKRTEQALKKDPILGPFLKDMKNMAEIQRLWSYIFS